MTEKERRQVGLKLRGLRERHDFHQKDIAQQTGLSVGTIQAIEYQKYEVRNSSYEKYAAVFGLTVNHLLRLDNPPVGDLTIRDAFAAAALFRLTADAAGLPPEGIATFAYRVADAMVKERSK